MNDRLVTELLDDRMHYKYGFSTDVESERVQRGLSEEIIQNISSIRNEPEFLTDFRMKAYRYWKTLQEPRWGNFQYQSVDYERLIYFSAPKQKGATGKLEDADPEILKTFKKLGIPIDEQKRLLNVTVDLVFDSVSIGTTFKKNLEDAGVIFCSFSEAARSYPDLVKKYLGSVVSYKDNFFAALNSAVFTDGSFVFVPAGVRCPMEISTYFRINDKEAGQFERTLIIAEKGAYVSYLEGCTAPAYSSNQLHAAVVELVVKEKAHVKYSTVQNWFSGSKDGGRGGVYNFVTKRGLCQGDFSKISWIQVEVGAAITWKYPSCILKGDNSVGEFYSVTLTNGYMQTDTGTKMVHLGKNTSSTIVSKGISADCSKNTFRSLVSMGKKAFGSHNYTQCDSMLIGNRCQATTFPVIKLQNGRSSVEHEASTSRLREDQLFYLKSRGFNPEQAIGLLVNGFCSQIISELPLEFAEESRKLLLLKLENSVG
ncbi:MAG: Fe-S cluster assembly protein SufB [Victivallaceae bacterium]